MTKARTKWCIATQKRGATGWDMGHLRFTEKDAKAAARQMDKKYPDYVHQAVKAER